MPPLIILSAPSSCGKNVIAETLLKRFSRLTRVITATTRARRPEEQEGRDYYFWTPEEFQHHIDTGDMLEWAQVHDHRYGIPRFAIDTILSQGKLPLLIIDVQGAKTITHIWPQAVTIFVTPENMQIMRQWLVARNRNTPQEIALRLENAKKEIVQASFYQHVVVNRDQKLQETIQEIAQIIQKAI